MKRFSPSGEGDGGPGGGLPVIFCRVCTGDFRSRTASFPWTNDVKSPGKMDDDDSVFWNVPGWKRPIFLTDSRTQGFPRNWSTLVREVGRVGGRLDWRSGVDPVAYGC